jgi:hypothetical protein
MQTLGFLFRIFCVVLKNTDCCLFKFYFLSLEHQQTHLILFPRVKKNTTAKSKKKIH